MSLIFLVACWNIQYNMAWRKSHIQKTRVTPAPCVNLGPQRCHSDSWGGSELSQGIFTIKKVSAYNQNMKPAVVGIIYLRSVLLIQTKHIMSMIAKILVTWQTCFVRIEMVRPACDCFIIYLIYIYSSCVKLHKNWKSYWGGSVFSDWI